MEDNQFNGVKRKPWRRPFIWPPSKWRFSPATQAAFDIITGIIFFLIISTVLCAIVVWIGLLYWSVNSVISGEDEPIRNILLAFGALLGLPFIVWRTIIASQQANISRESHYTDLFTRAIEQLGAEKIVKKREFKPRFKTDDEGNWLLGEDGDPISETRPNGDPIGEWSNYEVSDRNLEVRLGAIYALERISIDSHRDHWPIIETIAAYVRNNTLLNGEEVIRNPLLSDDIQSAIAVLGRRSGAYEPDNENQDIKIRSRNLSNYDFSCGYFKYSDFSYSDFTNCNFNKSVFDFCNISNAALEGSKLNNAKFSNVDFYNSRMNNSYLTESYYEDCSLVVSDITRTHILGVVFCSVDFTEASLSGAFIGSSTFFDCTFQRSNISKAVISSCKFKNCSFNSSQIVGSELNLNQYDNCIFDGANFHKTKLPDVIDIDKVYIGDVNDEVYSDIQLIIGSRGKGTWAEWAEERGYAYEPEFEHSKMRKTVF